MSGLTALVDLYVDHNYLVDVHLSVFGLTTLRSLCLDNNQLTSLPRECALLNVSCAISASENVITEPPMHILQSGRSRLPSLGWCCIQQLRLYFLFEPVDLSLEEGHLNMCIEPFVPDSENDWASMVVDFPCCRDMLI